MHKLLQTVTQETWLLNVAIFWAVPWMVGICSLVVILFEGFMRWLCGKGIYKHELLREITEA